MHALRWSSEAARKLYARIGESVHASKLDAAADAVIGTVRSHTLLETATVTVPTAAEAAEREAGERVRAQEALLARAVTHGGSLATAVELARAGVTIDDDAQYAAVHARYDVLLARAENYDRAASAQRGGSDDDDDDDDDF